MNKIFDEGQFRPTAEQSTTNNVQSSSENASGQPQKFGLAQSEKNCLAYYEATLNENFRGLLTGEKTRREIKQGFITFIQNEKRTLKAVGAKESAAVLAATFTEFARSSQVCLSLNNIRIIRTQIQERRKAEKKAAEAAAKQQKISELAAKWNLPLETAEAMFLAGALKL